MGKNGPIEEVDPNAYEGLLGLVWNRDPTRPISAAEAYALYERNWRHIDEPALTEAERRLIGQLTERFGYGAFLS